MEITPSRQDLDFIIGYKLEKYKGYYLQFNSSRFCGYIFQALRNLDPLYEVYDAEAGTIETYTTKDKFKVKFWTSEVKIIKQHQIFEMKSYVGAEYMVTEMKKLIDKYVKNDYKFKKFPKIPYIELTIKQRSFK